jgi:hypothetical protein
VISKKIRTMLPYERGSMENGFEKSMAGVGEGVEDNCHSLGRIRADFVGLQECVLPQGPILRRPMCALMLFWSLS